MSAKIQIISAQKYIHLLKQQLKHLVTLDCTWYPAEKDGYHEYKAEHIAGARYFPFTEIKTESPYPHMMPKNFAEFAAGASKLGLHRRDFVVVYDQVSYLSAPRVAWLLATFGHKDVYLLDNYQLYKKLGGVIESGECPNVEPTSYELDDDSEDFKQGRWLDYDDILKILEAGEVPSKYNLIDARASARFAGSQPEPRPGIQSGHMPGSKNIPFSEVVDDEGHFKSKSELETIFQEKGLDPSKNSIVLCGSGVTACVVKAAIDHVFDAPADIYDGSWSEWGQRAPFNLVEKS